MTRIILILAAAGMISASGLALADGFDDGIPEGWICEGECGTLGADGVVSLAPKGGDAYGWVATASNSPTGLALEGVGGDGNPTSGSRLRSSIFEASAGDDLEFQFNYVTSDGGGFADYAWARLLDSDLNEVALLFTARTTPGGTTVPGFEMPDIEAEITPEEVTIIDGGPEWSPLGGNSGSCYSTGCGYTDWVQSNFEIPADGSYVLEFGAVNWNDTSFQSGMAFDGITVEGEPIGGGPGTGEPGDYVSIPTLSRPGLLIAALILMMMGMLALRGRFS